MTDHPESCRSEDGITVGLIDALIGIMRVLAPRDLSTASAQEALTDLLEDPDFHTVRHGWRPQHSMEETDDLPSDGTEAGPQTAVRP